jgi:hypothetical protein
VALAGYTPTTTENLLFSTKTKGEQKILLSLSRSFSICVKVGG